MHSGVFDFTPPSHGVDSSITLDAAKSNGTCGELSSCVINTMPLDYVLQYSEHFLKKFTS